MTAWGCINSGLVYYLYRYYDPNLQRWLNRDPFADDGSLVWMIASFDSGDLSEPRPLKFAFGPFEEWSGPNIYSFVENNPITRIDAFGLEGLDSPSATLNSAIARGDCQAIKNILGYADDLSVAQKQRAMDALSKYGSKACNWISKECKGSINREFPDQFRNNTLEEILNAAKRGDKAAKKAWKLLNDSRFKK